MSWLSWFYPGDMAAQIAGLAFLQAALVALLVLAAARVVFRRSAPARHTLYGAALGYALVSPHVVTVRQTFDVPGIQLRVPAVVIGAAAKSGLRQTSENRGRSHAADARSAAADRQWIVDGRWSGLRANAGEVNIVNRGQAATESDDRRGASRAFEFTTTHAMAILFAVWVAGVGLHLARIVHGCRLAAKLRRRAVPVRGAFLKPLLAQLRDALGVRDLPPIATSADIGSPITVGMLRPVVLVPESLWTDLPRDKLRDVLLHECAHAIRRDCLAGLVQRAIVALYWPHPLIRLVSRQLSRTREEICDNFVLRRTAAVQYGQLLFELAQLTRRSKGVIGVSFVATRWRLHHRIAGLLDPRRGMSTSAGLVANACLAVAVLAAGGVIAVTRVIADQQEAENRLSGELVAINQAVPEDPSARALGGVAATRVDLYGDPIPYGAAVRLGTVRFRLDSSWDQGLGFSADGRQLVSASGAGRICYWNPQSGKLMRESNIGGVSMTAFEMSPDRSTLANLGFEFVGEARRMDNVVELWDVQTGQRRSEIRWTQGPRGDTAALAFSSDGKYIVAGSTVGQLRVWDVASRTQLLAYDLGEGQRIGALAFSPDGEQIGIGTLYETALWNWSSGEAPHAIALEGPKRRGATALAFSPNGEYLAVALHDGIQLLDVATKELVAVLQDEPPGLVHVRQLVFSQEGGLLFAPNDANDTNIVNGLLSWDVATGKLRYKLVSPSVRPRCVTLSPDGELVAFAGNAEITVFDLSSGMRLADHLQGHGDIVTGVRFVPGSGLIVTSSDDRTVRLWDAETGTQVRVMQHDSIVRGLAVSADGRRIASSSLDDTVRLWEVATGREVQRLQGHGRLGGHRALAFTPDSRRLYSWGDHDQALRVWDLAAGETLVDQPLVSATGVAEASAFRGFSSNEAHLFSLRGAAFSRDCRWIGLLRSGSAQVFATASVKQQQSFSSSYGIDAIAFWPDGERFLLARASQAPTQTELVNGGVRFSAPAAFELVAYRLGSPHELWTFALDDRPGPLGISPDGKWIAASARNHQQLFLLEAATGRCVDQLGGIEGMGWPGGDLRLAFSDDSDKLALALSNGTVLVWNIAEGRFVAALTD